VRLNIQPYSATAAALVQSRLREPCSVYYLPLFYARQIVSCSFVPPSHQILATPLCHWILHRSYSKYGLSSQSLQLILISLSSLASFRRQLKTELFVRSFPDLGSSAYDRIWLTLCFTLCVALAFCHCFSVVKCPCGLFDITPPKSFLFIIIIITIIILN